MTSDTEAERVAAVHARENCPFYPACYVAGDCSENDWKTGDCGLPDDEKAKARERDRERFKRTVERAALCQHLSEIVGRGDLDHLRGLDLDAVRTILKERS